MKISRFLLALAFVLLLPFQVLFAQFSLSGIVDGSTAETQLLEGVLVYIPELNRIDISKDGGTYIFRGLGKSVYRIQYSKSGYKTIVKTIDISDTATVIHVSLEKSGSDERELSSVSNKSVLPSLFPYSVESYSLHRLENSASMNVVSALAYQPGIDWLGVGNGLNKPVLRGLSLNSVQVHQFGTRIESQNWNERYPLGVNVLGTERIELVKGPASLMYGADAAGGVLIFSDAKPPVVGNVEGNVSAAFHSNTLGYVTDAGLKGMSENGIFYGLRFGMQSHTSYVQGAETDQRKNTEDLAFAANSKFNSQQAKAHLGISKGWGMSKISYSYLQQQSGIIGMDIDSLIDPMSFNDEQRKRKITSPYLEFTNHIIALENTILAGHSHIHVNLAYQSNTSQEFEFFGNDEHLGSALQLNSTTFDARFSSNPVKKFGYSLGSQGILQSNKNSGTEGFAPDASMTSLGAFFMLRYDIKHWNFLAGARFDFRKLELEKYETEQDCTDFRSATVHRDYQPINGSAGIVFHPTDDLSFKLNGATGFSVPNYMQLYAHGLNEENSRFEIGNDSLRFEQNAGLDLGIVWESNSIALNAGVFYNQLYDHIYLTNTGGYRLKTTNPGDGLVPVYYYSQSTATMTGGELSLAVYPANLKWVSADLAYSLQRAALEKGGDLAMIPADKAVFGLQFQSERMNYLYAPFIKVVFSHYFDQELVAVFETSSPGYSLLDLHLGGNIKWGRRYLSLRVSAYNLLNESYSNHLSLLRSSGIREMGRNVVISLSMPFGIRTRL